MESSSIRDLRVDWIEMYMERMIGSLGKLGRKVDIGRKMNDPDGALDPWSCLDICNCIPLIIF